MKVNAVNFVNCLRIQYAKIVILALKLVDDGRPQNSLILLQHDFDSNFTVTECNLHNECFP